MEASAAGQGQLTAGLPHPSAGARRGILIAGALLYVAGTIGTNIGPAWVDERPAVLLALSSRNRNLFGSVPFIDPLPYAVIGFLRLMLVGIVLFLIGRWYGTRAVGWMEGQIGELPAIYRWVQTGVDRAGWLLVLVMPGSNIVSLMAGHRRMDPRRFVPLLAIGIGLKLIVLWIGGRVFEDQIKWFLDAIEGYQWYIVGALFLLTFAQAMNKARKVGPDVIHEIEHPDVDATPDT